MSTLAKPPLPSLLVLLLPVVLAFAPKAAARNVIEGFTRAPTFTPPVGCIPTEKTYGVLSRCEKIEPGRAFVVLIDTAAGWGAGDKLFVTDHVAEIKMSWAQNYPGKNLTFSSKVSDVVPSDAPPQGTTCIEYSITAIRSPEAVLRVEGLTCAWRVEDAAAGQPSVELFWLEAFDLYTPHIGQRPMESFDLIVRELFASVRLSRK